VKDETTQGWNQYIDRKEKQRCARCLPRFYQKLFEEIYRCELPQSKSTKGNWYRINKHYNGDEKEGTEDIYGLERIEDKVKLKDIHKNKKE